MSAIVNGPKNGSRKPNDERTDLVHLLGRGDAVLDDLRGLPEQRELDAVGHEARAVADDHGRLAEPGECRDDHARRRCSSVAGVGITSTHGTRSGGTNQCTPRKRPGRCSPAASSAIGMDDVFVAMTAPSPAAASIAA